MSLRIVKPGVLDTIQDGGRWGYQHLGININGPMDRFSAQLGNALLGKDLRSPVIEMHFPAAQVEFTSPTIICLTGADFAPTIDGVEIPMHHPIMVGPNAFLKCNRMVTGARCYLSVWHDLELKQWLNSYSTNLRASVGGIEGRNLAKDDIIPLIKREESLAALLQAKDCIVMPWKSQEIVSNRNNIQFIIGSEWQWMSSEARETFLTSWFQVTIDADRVGYKLAGPRLESCNHTELISAPVSFGTVQWLPDGQLIILMADHQTTGGYPRVAQVISAHLPILAQKKANDVIQFELTDLAIAETKKIKQQKYLQQLQLASKLRIEEYLS
ncbi:MAG TPA: biotin-dependent carboxyltransferase family protein [Flavisolibacter sp.]|nr:biotin-dependent carboxyltransferase family protein [Flavisolibacter sp.]